MSDFYDEYNTLSIIMYLHLDNYCIYLLLILVAIKNIHMSEDVMSLEFLHSRGYRVTIEDHFWRWLYLPVVALAERIARLVGLMQQGRIGTYLLYSFATLIATLLVVKR